MKLVIKSKDMVLMSIREESLKLMKNDSYILN